MSRLWLNRRFQFAVFGVAGVFVGLLVSRLFIRNDHVPFPGMSFVAYDGMRDECHPVWYSLACGQIHAGQSVNDVIRKTSPATVTRHGIYTTMGYEDNRDGLSFTGITLIARHDRLVSAEASSCTWSHRFFSEMTRDEDSEWIRTLNERISRRGKAAEQEQ